MGKFTIEQKRVILKCVKYESQFINLIDNEAYCDSPAYSSIRTWISQTLGLDFDNDIYNNDTIIQLNRIDRIKNEIYHKYDGGWFVGDALILIVYNSIDVDKMMTDEFINNIDKQLVDCWTFFKKITKISKNTISAQQIQTIVEEVVARLGIEVCDEEE